jgi:hypothetical protein
MENLYLTDVQNAKVQNSKLQINVQSSELLTKVQNQISFGFTNSEIGILNFAEAQNKWKNFRIAESAEWESGEFQTAEF